MKSLFSLDSPVIRFLGKVADLMILNILYLISCIPLFTIGTATAALYDVTARLTKDDALIWRHYWQAFRSNFKKSTIAWLILAVIAGIILGIACVYWSWDMPGEEFSMTLLAVATIVWVFAFSWTFPLQARFENTVRRSLLNSLIFSLSFLPRTIVMAVLNVIPVVVFYFLPGVFLNFIFVFLIIWFSLAAYLTTLLLKKPMDRLESLAQGA